MSNMWMCLSTPPAATLTISVEEDEEEEGKERKEQHVAPSKLGKGRVMGDVGDARGRSWRWERYDETRMYLVGISSLDQLQTALLSSTHPGIPRLNPDTQSGTSTLPFSSGALKLLLYSTSMTRSVSPALFAFTQLSRLPLRTCPSTTNSNGTGFSSSPSSVPFLSTLLISSESWNRRQSDGRRYVEEGIESGECKVKRLMGS